MKLLSILMVHIYVRNNSRFETPAEIKTFRLWGADVVGMTNVPECQLAREAEMCYATISMVTNFAAGISPTILTHKEVVECMDRNIESFRKITMMICESFDTTLDCECRHAGKDFGDSAYDNTFLGMER